MPELSGKMPEVREMAKCQRRVRNAREAREMPVVSSVAVVTFTVIACAEILANYFLKSA